MRIRDTRRNVSGTQLSFCRVPIPVWYITHGDPYFHNSHARTELDVISYKLVRICIWRKERCVHVQVNVNSRELDHMQRTGSPRLHPSNLS